MDRSAVIKGLDALCAAAKARMPDRIDSPHLQFAEILWMTDEEVAEMHRLKSLLPSQKIEREQAERRIQEKHAKLR